MKRNLSNGIKIIVGNTLLIVASPTLDYAVSSTAYWAQVLEMPRYSFYDRLVVVYIGMPVFTSGYLIKVVLTYDAAEHDRAATKVLTNNNLLPVNDVDIEEKSILKERATVSEAETDAAYPFIIS